VTRSAVLDPRGEKLARGEFICEVCRCRPASAIVSWPAGTVRVCYEDFGSALDDALTTKTPPAMNRGLDKRTVHAKLTLAP
jgi:hypothetical protein